MPANNNTIPQPYVSKKEQTDVKYSLDYNQWLEIIECYIDLLKNSLLEGESVSIPSKLGKFEMKKYKSRYEIWKRTEEGKMWKTAKFPHHTDGNMALLKWIKDADRDRLYFGSLWKIKFTKQFSSDLKNKLFSNPSTINKYNDA